ncbi:MAG: hypothetical protein NVS3B12_27160 [Acidimicrobiales bacterium]
MIEFALIGIVLFSMLFGVIDFALIEASDNAGSNAAREGARQAILQYDCADLHAGCPPSNPALAAITAKVNSRLGGLTAGPPIVAVQCLDGSAAATPGTVKACDPTQIIADADLVEVDVTWTRIATSAFNTLATHADKAIMTILGSGQGTHSSSCQVTSASITPSRSQIVGDGSGHLTADASLTVATNNLCQPLYLSFPTGTTTDQSTAVAMTSNGTGGYSFTIGANTYSWLAGTYNLTLSEAGIYALSVTPAPIITVVGAACSIVAASISPSAVVLSGATSPSTLSQDVTVSATASSGCASLQVSFNADGATPRTLTMTGTSPNFTFLISASAYSWTVGAKNFSFFNPATSPATAVASPASVILQVALRCAATVSLSPASIVSGGGTAVGVTATPSAGADCSGMTLTYAYGTGLSSTAAMTLNAGVYTYSIPSTVVWQKGSWAMTFAATNSASVSTSPTPVQESAT